ncbi:unnamed protein product, partial [Rotaria sp. Silwood2]
MNNERCLHTASVLISGKVLVAGGYGYDGYSDWGPWNSSELYDPATGMWTRTGNMTLGRYYHTASILANGKVLVVGGYRSDEYSYLGSLNSSELYDPATGIWTRMGNLAVGRYFHRASVLTNGKVLVTGGYGFDGHNYLDILNSSELYDPTTGIWTKIGNMHFRRYCHTASVLANGKVLVISGYGSDDYSYWGYLNSTELYDPTTGIWTRTGNINVGRQYHTASVLTNGKVLVAGGYFSDGYSYWKPVNSSELYDPMTGIWTKTGNMTDGRYYHTASVLANGKVLVAGGYGYSGSNSFGILNSSELYDPSTGIWTMTSSMNTARSEHTASVLTNGKILVTGGYNGTDYIKSVE